MILGALTADLRVTQEKKSIKTVHQKKQIFVSI